LLSSVIRAHLADLFCAPRLSGFSQFRVTRDSELWVDEREVSDLRQALTGRADPRHFGNAVRSSPADLPETTGDAAARTVSSAAAGRDRVAVRSTWCG